MHENGGEGDDENESMVTETQHESVLVIRSLGTYDEKHDDEVMKSVKKMFDGKIFGVTRVPTPREIGAMKDIINYHNDVDTTDTTRYVKIRGQLVVKGSAFDLTGKSPEQLYDYWGESDHSDTSSNKDSEGTSIVKGVNDEEELNNRIDTLKKNGTPAQ